MARTRATEEFSNLRRPSLRGGEVRRGEGGGEAAAWQSSFTVVRPVPGLPDTEAAGLLPCWGLLMSSTAATGRRGEAKAARGTTKVTQEQA